MKWNLWACLYWLFWFVGFVVWETYAGTKKFGMGDIPMLTQVTVRWAPWWITMPGLTWLWVHFAVRYANPAYVALLRTGK